MHTGVLSTEHIKPSRVAHFSTSTDYTTFSTYTSTRSDSVAIAAALELAHHTQQ